jgi:hypothetical protein
MIHMYTEVSIKGQLIQVWIIDATTDIQFGSDVSSFYLFNAKRNRNENTLAMKVSKYALTPPLPVCSTIKMLLPVHSYDQKFL